MDLKLEIKKTIVNALMLDTTPENFADDEDLSTTLGIDSVGFLQILVALEDQFDLQLEEAPLQRESIKTIDKLAHLVENSLAGKDAVGP